MTKFLPGLHQLARLQAGVVTRQQLAKLGADRQLVERRVNAEVWHALGPRVVVLHRGRLGRDERWWAGYLHAAWTTGAGRREQHCLG